MALSQDRRRPFKQSVWEIKLKVNSVVNAGNDSKEGMESLIEALERHQQWEYSFQNIGWLWDTVKNHEKAAAVCREFGICPDKGTRVLEEEDEEEDNRWVGLVGRVGSVGWVGRVGVVSKEQREERAAEMAAEMGEKPAEEKVTHLLSLWRSFRRDPASSPDQHKLRTALHYLLELQENPEMQQCAQKEAQLCHAELTEGILKSMAQQMNKHLRTSGASLQWSASQVPRILQLVAQLVPTEQVAQHKRPIEQVAPLVRPAEKDKKLWTPFFWEAGSLIAKEGLRNSTDPTKKNVPQTMSIMADAYGKMGFSWWHGPLLGEFSNHLQEHHLATMGPLELVNVFHWFAQLVFEGEGWQREDWIQWRREVALRIATELSNKLLGLLDPQKPESIKFLGHLGNHLSKALSACNLVGILPVKLFETCTDCAKGLLELQEYDARVLSYQLRRQAKRNASILLPDRAASVLSSFLPESELEAAAARVSRLYFAVKDQPRPQRQNILENLGNGLHLLGPAGGLLVTANPFEISRTQADNMRDRLEEIFMMGISHHNMKMETVIGFLETSRKVSSRFSTGLAETFVRSAFQKAFSLAKQRAMSNCILEEELKAYLKLPDHHFLPQHGMSAKLREELEAGLWALR
ncbi:unnamed protein product [Symbiodinium microadriaticum]|nr:unnamed protein product [Symbiodinium sp. KB8]CAE7909169.1 unnamed protein product [Symbiodinium microadriaticum]